MQSADSIGDNPIQFNPSLDIESAARKFAQRGRVLISDVLGPSSAASLYGCLLSEVPWRLVYNDGEKNLSLDSSALEAQSERAQTELLRSVLSRAAERFQYLFRSYPMVTAYVRGEDPTLFLHYAFEWLNDPQTLEVMRRITGIETLIKVNAQATLYRPGHFLTQHDDSGYPEQHRRVAYVLYMTRGWRAEWGGQLQFLDAHGEVEEVWLPRFNSLALFIVPTAHLVSYVAPFAKEPRYAITGWLCDGPEKTTGANESARVSSDSNRK
jgi:Rps23 Pro-64 3,4-dihydroxylase Tpa1-like proline 4-hydroxylase